MTQTDNANWEVEWDDHVLLQEERPPDVFIHAAFPVWPQVGSNQWRFLVTALCFPHAPQITWPFTCDKILCLRSLSRVLSIAQNFLPLPKKNHLPGLRSVKKWSRKTFVIALSLRVNALNRRTFVKKSCEINAAPKLKCRRKAFCRPILCRRQGTLWYVRSQFRVSRIKWLASFSGSTGTAARNTLFDISPTGAAPTSPTTNVYVCKTKRWEIGLRVDRLPGGGPRAEWLAPCKMNYIYFLYKRCPTATLRPKGGPKMPLHLRWRSGPECISHETDSLGRSSVGGIISHTIALEHSAEEPEKIQTGTM